VPRLCPFVLFLFWVVSSAVCVLPSSAQVDVRDLAEDIWVTYGTVKEIGEASLVVQEFDFETDEEKLVSYAVDAGTVFQNFAALSEIRLDDDLVIEFTEKNGVKVALTITKEEIVSDSYPPAESLEEESSF